MSILQVFLTKDGGPKAGIGAVIRKNEVRLGARRSALIISVTTSIPAIEPQFLVRNTHSVSLAVVDRVLDGVLIDEVGKFGHNLSTRKDLCRNQ